MGTARWYPTGLCFYLSPLAGIIFLPLPNKIVFKSFYYEKFKHTRKYKEPLYAQLLVSITMIILSLTFHHPLPLFKKYFKIPDILLPT